MRRRERVARSVLRRIDTQRAATAAAYGEARTSRDRLGVLADAARAAAADGAHQLPAARVEAILAPALEALRSALTELHREQRRVAQTVINTEERRSRGSSTAATPR